MKQRLRKDRKRRNAIPGYRRQDLRPVEQTQDLRPVERLEETSLIEEERREVEALRRQTAEEIENEKEIK